MDLANEARNPEVRPERPRDLRAEVGMECAKMEPRNEMSFIDRDPAKQVVLSPQLENLVRRVGGCQTEEVMALVRRIMYEVISQRKS